MNKLYCSFQQTVYSKNQGIRLSRCMNQECEKFAGPLSPEICEACPLRQEPSDEQKAFWDTRFLMPEDEGPVRDEQMQLWILDNFCKKCIKYDCKNLTCTDCDCPSGQQPIAERVRLAKFHCPLKLW